MWLQHLNGHGSEKGLKPQNLPSSILVSHIKGSKTHQNPKDVLGFEVFDLCPPHFRPMGPQRIQFFVSATGAARKSSGLPHVAGRSLSNSFYQLRLRPQDLSLATFKIPTFPMEEPSPLFKPKGARVPGPKTWLRVTHSLRSTMIHHS